MRLREKGKGDDTIVSMGWDEAQAALQAGTHEVAEGGGRPTGAGELEAGGGTPEIDLDAMTRAELEAHAAERSIDVTGAKTKADVAEAIRSAS